VSFAARLRGTGAAERAAPVPAEATAEIEPVAGQEYVGLVTRTIAFVVDAALINVVAIVTAAAVSLIYTALSIPDELRALAIAGGSATYLLWTTGYFVTFWSTTGQTPGNRLLRIRVQPASGERIRPRRALLRFAALILAALPLFAGLLLILVDDRRRGLHDYLARTVVVEADDEGAAEAAPRRGRPRAQ
jgi:uncharacterized RDD family membrane protein YckC